LVGLEPPPPGAPATTFTHIAATLSDPGRRPSRAPHSQGDERFRGATLRLHGVEMQLALQRLPLVDRPNAALAEGSHKI
jgi:hypothetical protein